MPDQRRTAGRVHRGSPRARVPAERLARSFHDHHAYSICLAAGHLADPFWAGVAVGAQQEAEQHGYTLVVAHTGEAEEKERRVVEMLRERRVDGIILAPAHHAPRELGALRADSGRSSSSIARSRDSTCRRSSPTASRD